MIELGASIVCRKNFVTLKNVHFCRRPFISCLPFDDAHAPELLAFTMYGVSARFTVAVPRSASSSVVVVAVVDDDKLAAIWSAPRDT